MTAESYDRLALDYADRFLGELAGKPLDRLLLGLLAERVGGLGPIADLGCGPGQVARHLHDHGAPSLGMDLSPRMVEIAAQRHPGIGFQVGDMRALPVPDRSWGGIAAFYSIIHVPPSQLEGVFAEFFRVLRPGGSLLLSFHLGDELRHFDELWGHEVSLDFQFYRRDVVEGALEEAGLSADAYVERKPYESEVATTRAYVLARRP
ncbi:class I SAM-dependent DNA methyltransferase [Actinomadura scrupuli]|uniref:class I SAM-dependent DNA methyltransferase n=1 Tax=Actinomadura scrupuli TaxID=559629 RepID=UPI003D97E634